MTRRVCAGSFFISGVVMAGEHVILLDEQDKPTGMLEKYAAHTSIPLCISRFPAGCSMNKVSCWSRAVRWAKSLARRMDELSLRASANRRNLRTGR
jgi:hypothetical protein